jgi:SAM-dependent methyltransferase
VNAAPAYGQRLFGASCDDPGIGLFLTALKAGAPMAFAPGMRILDVGCCEADLLGDVLAVAMPELELVGVDWRAKPGDGPITRVQANALDPDTFAPESFDAVTALSAIEHFGLGHYSRDPIDPEGDRHIVANVWRWLKPGGWFYFDVPYDPTGYRVEGTKCRVYDDAAILTRLHGGADGRFLDRFDAYACAHDVGHLIEKPAAAVHPFHYCAMVWRKPA